MQVPGSPAPRPRLRRAGVFARTGDTRRLAQVGDWIIDCATGEVLMARFRDAARESPNERPGTGRGAE